jgi:hypothetical protein
MHMLCQLHLAFDQLIGPLEDRHITPADVVENIKGILSGICKAGISR